MKRWCMKKLFLTTILLLMSTLGVCSDNKKPTMTREQYEKFCAAESAHIDRQLALAEACFVTVPSADEIATKLKSALGEQIYTEYVERNPRICAKLAQHNQGCHFKAQALAQIITASVLGYNHEEKLMIQTAVLTALVKAHPHALEWLQKTGYIDVEKTE
jgi:hypothetical protein